MNWLAHLQELAYLPILDCGEILWMFTKYHVLMHLKISAECCTALSVPYRSYRFTPVYLGTQTPSLPSKRISLHVGFLQSYSLCMPVPSSTQTWQRGKLTFSQYS